MIPKPTIDLPVPGGGCGPPQKAATTGAAPPAAVPTAAGGAQAATTGAVLTGGPQTCKVLQVITQKAIHGLFAAVDAVFRTSRCFVSITTCK